MEDVLLDLARSECGKRLIINIWEGLNSRHIEIDSVNSILGALTAASTWDDHKRQIAKVIFGQPDTYQFIGPTSSSDPAEWMTIKSMSDLLMLLRGSTKTLSAPLQKRLGIIDDGGTHTGMEPEHYVRFAELLSDVDEPVSFLLAKCFNARAAPSWYSRWTSCGFRHKYALPSTEASGRFRDWLGLTYGLDDPLFVVRARRPINVDAIKAHRPTAWDGFDNPLYKHYTSAEHNREACGSATDLRKVRSTAVSSKDIEGGPEVISKGILFHPQQFVCEYLGAAPVIEYELYDAPFHALLLRAGRTIDWVIERILHTLNPGKTSPA